VKARLRGSSLGGLGGGRPPKPRISKPLELDPNLDCWVLFSRQGAETPAAGIPEFRPQDRLVVLRRVSAGSGTNGHTAVVVLLGRLPVSGVGSIGIVPIGHVAY
jgi:hypothetical protein